MVSRSRSPSTTGCSTFNCGNTGCCARFERPSCPTAHYWLLWAAALLSSLAPSLMVLNEPEISLHPNLVRTLASLTHTTAAQTQIGVVSHSCSLLEFLDTVPVAKANLFGTDAGRRTVEVELYKD